MFDHELTNQDKVELLKIKLEHVLRNLTGSKRKKFILTVIALLLFSVGGNFALFVWFMERLRALIGANNDADTIIEYVIESYREFNAPLPKELIESLPEELLNSITNIN